MIANIDNIIYPLIKTRLSTAEDVGKFNDVITELSVNKYEDCENAAETLYNFLESFKITNNIKLYYNKTLFDCINNIKTEVQNIDISNILDYLKYNKCISYFMQYPNDTELTNYSSFDGDISEELFNKIIDNYNTLKSNVFITGILNFIFNSGFEQTYKELNSNDDYNELNIPTLLYNIIVKNSEKIDLYYILNLCLSLLNDKLSNNEFILSINIILNNKYEQYLSKYLTDSDSTTLVNEFLNLKIDDSIVKDIILGYIDKDDITNNDITNLITKIDNTILNMSNDNTVIGSVVNTIKEGLEKNVSIVETYNEKKSKVIKKTINDIIIDISSKFGIRLLLGQITNLADDKDLKNLGYGIIYDLLTILTPDDSKTLKKIKSDDKEIIEEFFNHLSLLLHPNENNILLFFNTTKLFNDNVNKQNIIDAIILLLENKKLYPSITAFYYARYIKL